MSDDLIQLPELTEVREMLVSAKQDISSEIQEDAELASQGKLVTEVIDILDGKLGKDRDLNKLSLKEKIDVAAHLNFLQCLLEDFFFAGEGLDDDFEDGDEEFEFEEEEAEEEV